ncbi:hypothetical protein QFZ81_003830 [Paenibacillus sp. V4I9]|uniref:DUF6042 family protein n=1 Tax=Paenibacillus sp. V4I9 TaxID=3042308 RepID=UPI002788EACA|nr:DUF6042 family protein [Paenibacillus sp. V4I9]MDQ0888742.1 hypothetical protein [Paenibacillus sp. V4I9]
MNNGEITVRLLSQIKMIPEGQCIMPQSLYDYGWLSCLPLVNIITLPQISNCIALEFSKERIIDYLIRNNDKEVFWKLRDAEPVFNSVYEKSEYNLYYAREVNVRYRLEKNGFYYPRSMQDVIQLFIDLGFVIEVLENENELKLDLIIRPFPNIENVLKFI